MDENPYQAPQASQPPKPRFNASRLAEGSVFAMTIVIFLALLQPATINGVPAATGPLYSVVIPWAIAILLSISILLGVAWVAVMRKHW